MPRTVVQDGSHVLPAVPAPTEASCMCSSSTSSSVHQLLYENKSQSFLFPLQLPPTLVPSMYFQLPVGSSHPQLHCQESSEHPDGDKQELHWTHSSIKFWLYDGHSIQADPEDDAKLHQLFKNGIPLGSTKIIAGKMDFVATNGRSGLYRLQILAGFATVTHCSAQTTMPWCPAWRARDLSAQPQHFPVGSLGEVARIQLLPGAPSSCRASSQHMHMDTASLHQDR